MFYILIQFSIQIINISIPKGTVIYEDPVGYQGSLYLGGQEKIQIFIRKPWDIDGVKVLSESPIP